MSRTLLGFFFRHVKEEDEYKEFLARNRSVRVVIRLRNTLQHQPRGG
ncbi:hypothetical protein [Massilia aurea]|nr:hypothetical protein [Massilia aurea]